jgi:hypothetical protein
MTFQINRNCKLKMGEIPVAIDFIRLMERYHYFGWVRHIKVIK